jgi:large subunit ribosomal protein LX
MSAEIKIFKIVGTYLKEKKKYKFSKEIRALKEVDALEKALTMITSIGLYRRQIKIQEIREIKPEECEDYLIRELNK